MRVTIVPSSKESFVIDGIVPSTSIGKLKQLIQERDSERFPVDRQLLTKYQMVLANEHGLSYYLLDDDCEINLQMAIPPETTKVRILVEVTSHYDMPFNAYLLKTHTVWHIMQTVETFYKIPPSEQTLLCADWCVAINQSSADEPMMSFLTDADGVPANEYDEEDPSDEMVFHITVLVKEPSVKEKACGLSEAAVTQDKDQHESQRGNN